MANVYDERKWWQCFWLQSVSDCVSFADQYPVPATLETKQRTWTVFRDFRLCVPLKSDFKLVWNVREIFQILRNYLKYLLIQNHFRTVSCLNFIKSLKDDFNLWLIYNSNVRLVFHIKVDSFSTLFQIWTRHCKFPSSIPIEIQ